MKDACKEVIHWIQAEPGAAALYGLACGILGVLVRHYL